jgi:hypothetical protein
MISDLNETIKRIKRCPLGYYKVDILFEVLESRWAASISKLTVNSHLIMIRRDYDLLNHDGIMECHGNI